MIGADNDSTPAENLAAKSCICSLSTGGQPSVLIHRLHGCKQHLPRLQRRHPGRARRRRHHTPCPGDGARQSHERPLARPSRPTDGRRSWGPGRGTSRLQAVGDQLHQRLQRGEESRAERRVLCQRQGAATFHHLDRAGSRARRATSVPGAARRARHLAARRWPSSLTPTFRTPSRAMVG